MRVTVLNLFLEGMEEMGSRDDCKLLQSVPNSFVRTDAGPTWAGLAESSGCRWPKVAGGKEPLSTRSVGVNISLLIFTGRLSLEQAPENETCTFFVWTLDEYIFSGKPW